MAPIKIPKTPPSAYDDRRKASDLLRAHVANLERAVHGKTRAAGRASLNEGEAARYIRELARQLHQKELLPQVAAAPTVGQRPKAKRRKRARR
jgi:hypothetical protein